MCCNTRKNMFNYRKEDRANLFSLIMQFNLFFFLLQILQLVVKRFLPPCSTGLCFSLFTPNTPYSRVGFGEFVKVFI